MLITHIIILYVHKNKSSIKFKLLFYTEPTNRKISSQHERFHPQFILDCSLNYVCKAILLDYARMFHQIL